MGNVLVYLESAGGSLRPASLPAVTFARNLRAHIEVVGETVVASVRQTEFAAAPPLATPGATLALDPGTIDAQGAEVLGVHASKNERPDLSDARVVVSGGRGMREGKN